MNPIESRYRQHLPGRSAAAAGRDERTKTAVLAGAFLFTLAVLAGIFLMHLDRDSGAARSDEQRLLDAAMNRIRAHGSGEPFQPSTTGPRLVGTGRTEQDIVGDVSALESPDGFTFASFKSEMPKRRIVVPNQSVGPHPDWIDTTQSIAALSGQARLADRDWTFGWLLLVPEAGRAGISRSLSALGVDMLGSAGRLIRARLPGDEVRLREIAATADVAGFGATPEALKIPTEFARALLDVPDEQRPVFITLMADDPDGRWRRTLERLGAVVGTYDASIRVYTAALDYVTLRRLASADFVLAVEPVGVVETAHDTAVPALGVDALRNYTGSSGVFEKIAGASVPVGVMDTGLNIRHADIATNRESICGANFQWLGSSPDEDLWTDYDGHGTHVTGTIAGNGFMKPRLAGLAPSVRHIRFAKVLSSIGGTDDVIVQGMDWLAQPTGCQGSQEVLPLIVNVSLAAQDKLFVGRETSTRKLDAIVYDTRQLYVVAQANAGSEGFSNYAGAKNSLSVGAAFDAGEIADFSSHGPTADGRLAPQVVATGVDVCSAEGDGSPAGYICSSGTSMAAPVVAGVAALLMHAIPGYQSQPAATRARLMASAVRPDAWLEDADAFPLDNSFGPGRMQARYGLGRVSAHTAMLDHDIAEGWFGGTATTEVDDGEYAYVDIEVPPGASRLDIAMTWDEPPADVVVAPVLNDLDLWLDLGADCSDGPCGERASTSRIDNVEWIVVRDPEPGTYRAKIVANRVYTGPPHAAVAWTVIRGSATPSLAVEAENRALATSGDGQLIWNEVSLELTTSAYVAAGTRLHFACRGAAADCAEVVIAELNIDRLDGTNADGSAAVSGEMEAPDSVPLDAKIPIGEIAAGESRRARMQIAFGGEAPIRLYAIASAWNADSASTSVLLRRPGDAGNQSEAEVPTNDDFAAPTVVGGVAGSVAVDLVRATSQPGEPLYEGGCLNDDCFSRSYWGCPLYRDRILFERPRASAWYEWTASENGLAGFRLATEGEQGIDGIVLSAYDGSRLAALRQLAVNHWEEPVFVGKCLVKAERRFTDEVAFFAERGRTYRIRIAADVPTPALALHWFQGRPSNDDFVAAQTIEGSEGIVAGTNAGATLEAGESFGPLAATVWYRWTAPRDDDFTFEVGSDQQRVAVFEGGDVRNARLVSAFPGTKATFRAALGRDYRIVVAARDAFAHPGRFELRWDRPSWWYPTDDHFTQAEEAELGERHFVSLRDKTVEPDEPLLTGIRTQWWTWTAPATGTYTWKYGEEDEYLAVAVFTGSSLTELKAIASNALRRTAGEFTFPVVEGESYAISVGWPMGVARAYLSEFGSGGFWQFGATPVNDVADGAIALGSTRGSTLASAAYATTGPGELTDSLGRWSLWWIYEPPTSGWYRFYAVGGLVFDAGLAVYDADSLHVPISRSGWLDDESEVVFFAEAGRRYAIRVGIRGYGLYTDYELKWEPTRAPAWLRYAGAQSSQSDEDGDSIRISNPAQLALDAAGGTLFAATDFGLAVFRRDVRTGALTARQTVAADVQDSALLWDGTRSRLLADRCGTWLAFAMPSGSDSNEFAVSEPTIVDDTGSCGAELFAMAGSSIYRVVADEGIEHFAVGDAGNLAYVDSLAVRRMLHAVPANDGDFVYASTGWSLDTIERDAETGSLTELDSQSGGGGPLAVTTDGRNLFVIDAEFGRADVHAMNDGIPGRRFDLLSIRFALERLDWRQDRAWRFAVARHGQPGIDLVADDGAVGVTLRDDELRIAEELGDGLDRFGNYVPLFGAPNGIAASPDGAHLYVSTADHGILRFERIPADVVGDDYVRLDALTVESGMISLGSVESADCIALADTEVDGGRYRARAAKWQSRPNADWPWADLAGTSVADEVCAYSPQKSGHFRLAVDMDIDGVSGRYVSNTITVDDHGDSTANATSVEIPSATEGWIEDPADADYFKLVVDEAGKLNAHTEGWLNATGTLYDEAGVALASDDDSGRDRNFSFSTEIEAGTYFVRVGSAVGPGAYTLRVALATDEASP